jgi:CHASE2 domain-containing sensor protein
MRPRFEHLLARQRELLDAVPDRSGNATVALRLNQLSRWFPRPILWIALGLVALAIRRPRGSGTLVTIALAALLVVLLNAFGLFADRHFVLPVAPAFVLLGLGALLGERRSPGARTA